jgi:hypothetical protein
MLWWASVVFVFQMQNVFLLVVGGNVGFVCGARANLVYHNEINMLAAGPG